MKREIKKQTDSQSKIDKEIKTVAYTYLIGDLLHYGHLRLLQQAKSIADYHVCGVIADDIAQKWQPPIICTYKERASVIQGLACVDEIMCQNSMDPTANLKRIHQRFPDACLVLFQGHQKWGQMPGVEYIRQIGGEVIRPEYYPRLSRDRIVRIFLSEVLKKEHIPIAPSTNIKLGNINHFDEKLSTKANTLNNLKLVLKKAKIEQMFVFTVKQWENKADRIVNNIKAKFNGKIVVRSSAQSEDALEFSSAGLFDSVLNVDSDDTRKIREAIQCVINSYRTKGDHFVENQVLIQPQAEDIVISGVVFTREPNLNKPYYVINYDDISNKTNSVTSGLAGKKVEILRDVAVSEIPVRWRNLIAAVREVENLLSGMVLDIEFAVNKQNEVIIFQVRPLAASRKFYLLDDDAIKERIATFQREFLKLKENEGILSSNVYLSDMTFWNPAEIIGDHPNYLDYSLYSNLILKTNWNEGLVPLGYSRVDDSLMTLIGGKPYINVHHAFYCLLPQDLSKELKIKLLNFYNKKLKDNPELHDKIEFEIVHNCFDFKFDESLIELRNNNFTDEEITELRESLIRLTNNILQNYAFFIESDLNDIKTLKQKREKSISNFKKNRDWRMALDCAGELLMDCKRFGTTQFSRVARLAFIGNRLIQSARDLGAIETADYNLFISTISTVATELNQAFSQLRRGKLSYAEFLEKYGHLRPGTYDITSLTYKDYDYFNLTDKKANKDYAKVGDVKADANHVEIYKSESRITKICSANGISVDGKKMLEFVKTTTQLRELFKFEFTKNLSEALEMIAYAGEQFGFGRSDFSHLDYNSLLNTYKYVDKEELVNIWRNLIAARKDEKRINALISLPPLLFSEKDFVVVQHYSSRPNFVTNLTIMGEVLALESYEKDSLPDLDNKIVVLEKADPGYDWIFTNEILGLITKYGGVASHMAIRCAEFNIPAAIGCGELLFSKALQCRKILLDCGNRKIDFI